MELFSITNSLGETINLHDRNGNLLFFDPEGFGLEEGTSYTRIGNEYVVTEQYYEQHEISGTLVITGAAFYQDYFSFISFCQHAPLTLNYGTSEEYHIKARLSKCEKGDKSNNHMLVCNIEFKAMSLWYRLKVGIIKGSGADAPDVYPLTYDTYKYPSEVRQSVNIEVDSAQDSPVMLQINGPATNPVWRHYVNGVLVSTGKYVGTISEGKVLCIDNTVVPYSISERTQTGTLIADRYQLCDFTTDRFFYAKEGKNTFSVAHEGVDGLDAKVEVRIYYASV